MRSTLFTAILGLSFSLLGHVSAGDARQGWRGDGSGNFAGANPPLRWSAKENVVWKTPMEHRSNAGLIMIGERLFTCAEPATLICLDARDGKILWQETVELTDAEPAAPEAAQILARWKAAQTAEEKKAVKKAMLRHDYFEVPPVMGEHFGFHMEYTMPTPTTDGTNVWVVYGTGLVASYTADGKRSWLRMLAKPSSSTGLAASPLLAGGRLLINLGGELHGLDPATGKTIWASQQKERYGSPVRATIGGVEYAVLTGGDVIRAHDGVKSATNAALNIYQSAVVHRDVVYSMRDDAFSTQDEASAAMMAVRLKPAADGTLATEKLWETKEKSGYSSPLYADGVLYNSRNKTGLLAFDAATGALLYEQKFSEMGSKESFGGENFPCLARAGKHLFVPLQTGRIFVVELGRQCWEVAVNSVCAGDDQLVAAPFFHRDRLYLRTHNFVFCLNAK